MLNPGNGMDRPSAQNVTYCSLCSKPFTIASSYKRHVAYCKKSQHRPKKRQKSCRACNHAKAKCSFGSPCSRCVSRSVECVYDAPPRRQGVSTPIMNPTLSSLPISTPQQPDEITMLDEAGLAQAILQSEVGQKFFDRSITWDTTVDSILQGTTFEAPCNDAFQEVPGDTFEIASDIENIFGERVTTGHCITMFNEMNALSSTYKASTSVWQPSPNADNVLSMQGPFGNLTQLPMKSHVAQRNASLVLQSLRTFPQKMLSREDMPFFIHSYKHCDALPEPLAVCARICHMFDTSTPEIMPFIWRCIRMEQLRFMHDDSSKDMLLAASQAQIVYIMMMVIESRMRRFEWVQEILMMSGAVCSRLFIVSEDEMNRLYEPTAETTWEEWLYLESRKRKFIVWFIMSLILNTQTGITCNTEIRMLGLPAPRLVWESSDPLAWKRHRELESKSKIQTLGDLIDANHGHPALVKELDSWNAKSDQLGHLLNLAISIIQ